MVVTGLQLAVNVNCLLENTNNVSVRSSQVVLHAFSGHKHLFYLTAAQSLLVYCGIKKVLQPRGRACVNGTRCLSRDCVSHFNNLQPSGMSSFQFKSSQSS